MSIIWWAHVIYNLVIWHEYVCIKNGIWQVYDTALKTGLWQANHLHGSCWEWCLLFQRPLPFYRVIIQTDDWRSDRRMQLYHSCIDILVQQINDLSGRDIHFRFEDQLYRRSRIFLYFLCMDRDEVSNATMCPTTQCTGTTCCCPKVQLSDPDAVFPFRNTEEGREKVRAK